MDACVKRANEIVKERMRTWGIDDSNIGAAEMRELADAAWKIAYNECKIGLIKA